MTRFITAPVILAAVVLVRPEVDSGPSSSLGLFVAISNAESGGGGE
jgi:hypothetical protein